MEFVKNIGSDAASRQALMVTAAQSGDTTTLRALQSVMTAQEWGAGVANNYTAFDGVAQYRTYDPSYSTEGINIDSGAVAPGEPPLSPTVGAGTKAAAEKLKGGDLTKLSGNAQKDIVPTFVRGNNLEYNTENSGIFGGGKEWRWLDLRSLRFQSDRIDSGTYNKTNTELFLKTDIDRSDQRYVYFRDLNGFYNVETFERINPYWQGDYATVHFNLAPPNNQPYTNNDIYLIGQLTNYELSNKTKMMFNPQKGVYQTSLFLKQGYYSYSYLTVNKNNSTNKKELEGDYWETENTYTILIYYKAFADRSDQLLGVTQLSSRADRPGISF